MYRVLVCDDDTAILESVAIYLQNEGYEVLTAVNGVDALEKVKTNEIHCMILDIMMPMMDGLRTTIKIREHYHSALRQERRHRQDHGARLRR